MPRPPRFPQRVDTKLLPPDARHPSGPVQSDFQMIFQWGTSLESKLAAQLQAIRDALAAMQAIKAEEEKNTVISSTVNVSTALDGDGSVLDPIRVLVDGITITVNGANQLETIPQAETCCVPMTTGAIPGEILFVGPDVMIIEVDL